jgi:hypothetical protein
MSHTPERLTSSSRSGPESEYVATSVVDHSDASTFSPNDGEARSRDARKPDTYCPGSTIPTLENSSYPSKGADSGYVSAGDDAEDPDETAEYYDDLLQQFREEGPTLANHGDNTISMIKGQKEKWEE